MVGLGLLTFAFQVTSMQSGQSWGGDFSSYIHQAIALFDGDVELLQEIAAFRIANSTTDIMVGPMFYPWGLPLLLAPIYGYFGAGLMSMKLLVLGFMIGCQVAAYVVARRGLPVKGALLIAFFMGFSPFLSHFKNNIVSDIPFTFFALLSLILIQRIAIDRRVIMQPLADGALLGAVICAAYLLRTHAVALIGTLFLVHAAEFYKRRFGPTKADSPSRAQLSLVHLAVPYAVFIVGVVGLQVMLSTRDSAVEYIASGHMSHANASEFLSMVVHHIAYYANVPFRFFDLSRFAQVLNIVVLLPLAIFGAYRRRSADYLLLAFAVCHMGILILYPWTTGVRFILPVIPLYLYFAVAGVFELTHLPDPARKYRTLRYPAACALALLVLLVAVRSALFWIDVNSKADFVIEGPYRDTSVETFDFIRDNTFESSVFIFWKPRVLSLYTSRRAVLQLTPEMITSGIADYLLIYTGPETRNVNGRFQSAVAERESSFELTFQNANFKLYRIKTANPQ